MTRYDFEAGTLNATVAAGATSGFSTVTAGSGNTIQYKAGVFGSLGVEFAAGTTNVAIAEINSTGATGTLFTSDQNEELRFSYKMPATAYGVTTTLLQFYGGAAGTTVIGRLSITTAGAITYSDVATAHTVTVIADVTATYGGTLTLGVLLNTGTTNTNGTVKVRYYATPTAAAGSYTTAYDPGTQPTWDFGSAGGTTAPVAKIRLGICTVQPSAKTVVLDGLEVVVGTSWLEPPANVIPVVTPGSTQTVVAGTVVTFSCTATDSDGTVSTLTGAITGPTTPTLTGSATGTGTASAALSQTATLTNVGTYTWTAPATDNNGGVGTGTTTVYVYPASGTYADPVAVTLGAWTAVGGTALAVITDSSLATYNEGPASPTVGQVQTITLPPHGPGPLSIEMEAVAFSGALNQTAKLYKADGVTLVDSVTYALSIYDGTTPTAYADLTAYAVGKTVTYGGSNYVVIATVGSGNTTKPDVSSSFANANYVWNPTVSSIPAATDRQALQLTIGDA